jgi:membrane-associated phospholipid phosphatase
VIETLKSIDYFLFHFINQSLASAWADTFLIFIRTPLHLQIIYVCLAVLGVAKFKKQGLYMLLAMMVTMALTDQISSHFFKPTFHRLRPCMEPLMQNTIRLLVPCSHGMSFTSSHAANNMGAAVLFAFMLPAGFRIFKIAFIGFAILVGFAQIYVGVHYPIDVNCGWMIGIIVGCLCGLAYRKLIQRINSNH